MLERLALELPVAMGWRRVLFANWSVDPGTVAARLPDRLDVDTHDGDAWLSVVPFVNVAVRPAGFPESVGVRLPELNLRTYVTRGDDAGVYFFSLDAAGVLGVAGARLFHHLPYYLASIRLSVEGDRVRFASRRRHPGARPAEFRATYGPAGDRFTADPGSLAHFLTERHRYYTESPGGALRYAAVDHEPWPLCDATATIEANTLFAADGFAEPDGDPHLLYSPGVDAVASGSRRAE